jgi:hypothetical protein
MNIFRFLKKKQSLATAYIIPALKGDNIKKLSVYDIDQQAYHEITLDEYCQKLKVLGLSDEEIAGKLKKIQEG